MYRTEFEKRVATIDNFHFSFPNSHDEIVTALLNPDLQGTGPGRTNTIMIRNVANLI